MAYRELPVASLESLRSDLISRIRVEQATVRMLVHEGPRPGPDGTKIHCYHLDVHRSRRSLYRSQLRLIHNSIESVLCDEPSAASP